MQTIRKLNYSLKLPWPPPLLAPQQLPPPFTPPHPLAGREKEAYGSDSDVSDSDDDGDGEGNLLPKVDLETRKLQTYRDMLHYMKPSESILKVIICACFVIIIIIYDYYYSMIIIIHDYYYYYQ